MMAYRTKARPLSGSDFREVRQQAYGQYLQIKRRSKRKPYVRSVYFRKEKVFLDLFWSHLFEKQHFADMMRRMKLYPCALELLRFSTCDPISKQNPNVPSETLHRFTGETPDGIRFFVQIKEEKRNGRKWLLSVFPAHHEHLKKALR